MIRQQFTTGQVAVGTSETTIVAARSTRAFITLKNLGSARVYIRDAGVTTSNGYPLESGETHTLSSTSAIVGIAASGTQTVAYIEEFDRGGF